MFNQFCLGDFCWFIHYVNIFTLNKSKGLWRGGQDRHNNAKVRVIFALSMGELNGNHCWYF